MITIKEYAEKSGKSVQAVYKQIKAKENAALLEGHILLQKIGNKNTKVLDDEAVRILDQASRQAPTVILQSGKDDMLEKLQAEKEQLANENKALLIKVAELQEQLLQEKDNVKLLQQEKIELLEEKQEQNPPPEEEEKEKETSFWRRLWHK
ncbi:MAG: hypothetical protein OSJ61_23235 [Lachnospiraceae bacterium]|nr:hypothetical protein [Lachnospiraceae bacterium]